MATVVRAIVPTGSAAPRGRPTAMVPVSPVPQAGCAVHRHLASAASRTPLAVAKVTSIAVKGAVTTAIVAPASPVRMFFSVVRGSSALTADVASDSRQQEVALVPRLRLPAGLREAAHRLPRAGGLSMKTLVVEDKGGERF